MKPTDSAAIRQVVAVRRLSGVAHSGARTASLTASSTVRFPRPSVREQPHAGRLGRRALTSVAGNDGDVMCDLVALARSLCRSPTHDRHTYLHVFSELRPNGNAGRRW